MSVTYILTIEVHHVRGIFVSLPNFHTCLYISFSIKVCGKRMKCLIIISAKACEDTSHDICE